MKASTFDQIVKARANERVQEKVRRFREETTRALNELTRGNSKYYRMSTIGTACLHAFSTSAKDVGEWPAHLWEVEREAVANELLATMDEVQKALLSVDRKPNKHDVQPSTKPTEGGA